MEKRNIYILILIFFRTLFISYAQISENPLSVELKGTHIAQNEPFIVSVKIIDIDPIPTVSFPEIQDFQKREVTKTTTTQKDGTKSKLIHVFTQHYYPTRKGTFFTSDIEVQVNKQILRAEGTTITVVGLEDEEAPIQLTPEFESEAKKGVFLATTADKNKIFLQEGFNLYISLLVSEDNTADLEFHNLEQQLEQILKKVKPKNCWEENFDIREIPENKIKIGGKPFIEYRIYQATFFPFNTQPISIPPVNLTMRQLREDTKANRIVNYPVFTSKPLTIQVSNLPPHPLRNQILVGNFRLSEQISNSTMQTGNTYQYSFQIVGEGNLSSIQEPTFGNNAVFDVYPPTITGKIERQNNRVSGNRKFEYKLIPHKSGEYKLGDMIYWIFFNLQTKQYDTLKSAYTLKIVGEEIEGNFSSVVEPNSIFAGLENWDTTKYVTDYQLLIKYAANFLIIVMLVAMVYIFNKK